MSFSVSYKPMLSLELRGEEGPTVLKGFRFEPTRSGARELARLRVLCRPAGGVLRLHRATDPRRGTAPLVTGARRSRFSFALRAADGDEARRFTPRLGRGVAPQLYFDNLAPNGSVRMEGALHPDAVAGGRDAVRLVPAVFRFTAPGAPADTVRTIVVRSLADRDFARNFTLPAGADSAEIDLRGGPAGAVQVGLDGEGPRQRLYVDGELARDPPLAVIDLFWDLAPDAVDRGRMPFTIRFRRLAGAA